MSGKAMQPRLTTSLGTNHLVVCCDTGQLTFGARFELVTPCAWSSTAVRITPQGRQNQG